LIRRDGSLDLVADALLHREEIVALLQGEPELRQATHPARKAQGGVDGDRALAVEDPRDTVLENTERARGRRQSSHEARAPPPRPRQDASGTALDVPWLPLLRVVSLDYTDVTYP